MMTIQITGLDELRSALNDFSKRQIPFAVAEALNDTAKDAQAALVHEINDSFDRPTPYTLSSIYVRRATKDNLKAQVGIKDFAGKGIPASKYLAAQIEGGSRHQKRFERALQSVGALPPGYSVVPGAMAKLDAYGNIDKGLIVQLLSYFKAFPEMGYRANMTDRRRATLAKGNKKKNIQGVAYFVGQPGGMRCPLGIWARYSFGHGSAIKPILIFVPSVHYEKRFDFYYTVQKKVESVFDKNMVAAWERAIRTAK